VVLGPDKAYLLEHRLGGLLKDFALPSYEALRDRLLDGRQPGLAERVVEAIVTHETSFFRDMGVFDAFSSELLANPDFAGNKQDYVRIWSAASSTGQEAYSLAICLRHWQLTRPNRNYEILVTDYSERVLKQAKDGKYSDLEVHRGLTEDQLKKYFEKNPADPHVWLVRPELKRNMNFRQVNLLEDWTGLGAFHVIFCRNVLIYQSVENKKRVISRLYNSLQPGGYLVLGAAETLIGLAENFEIRRLGRAVYYQKVAKP